MTEPEARDEELDTSGDEAPAPPQIEEAPDDDPVALNREVLIELRRLNLALERFNQKRRYIALSLTGGMARGFGAALGASLIFAIALALATRLITVPVVGEYVRDVMNFVRQNSPAGAVIPDPASWTVPPKATPEESGSPNPTPTPNPTTASEHPIPSVNP